MKLAIKVLTEWDRLNVIPFFEKHYPECNNAWKTNEVTIGDIFWVSENPTLYLDDDDFYKTPSYYTILQGVPEDMELPKVEKEYSHLTNKDEQLSFLRSAYNSLNHDYQLTKTREQELEEMFRCFVRTYHISDKWKEFLNNNSEFKQLLNK